jgi:peptidyl-prolyl cis-trans isomerase A (cyclophilin A)
MPSDAAMSPSLTLVMSARPRAHRSRLPGLAALALSAGLALGAAPAWGQKVKLETSAGDIVLELDAGRAPKTVANFLEYVKAGHYDGTIFHRVIPNFMIQGGGFTPDMAQKPTRSPIPLESRNGLANARGTVAMARTMVPDSASSQFFVNVVDNPFLDAANARDGHGYAVFGKVVQGMDVVDKIRAVPTANRGPHQNVPVEPVLILKASLEK